jgi:hypothetical protein
MTTQAENGRLDQIERRVAEVENGLDDLRVAVSRIEANQTSTSLVVSEMRGELKAVATQQSLQAVSLGRIEGGVKILQWVLPVFFTLGFGIAGLVWGVLSYVLSR